MDLLFFFLSLPYIADRSFSNVNDRASQEDIEDLEVKMSTLLANLTSFETNIIGKYSTGPTTDPNFSYVLTTPNKFYKSLLQVCFIYCFLIKNNLFC